MPPIGTERRMMVEQFQRLMTISSFSQIKDIRRQRLCPL